MIGSNKHPRSMVVRVLDGLGVFFLLILCALPVVFWPSIPDRVPAHMNFFGVVDRWGGKGNLIALPVVGLVLYILLSFAVGSSIANYPFAITGENAERQYALSRTFGTVLKVWLVMVFAYIELMMIRIAKGTAAGLGMWFGVISLGVLVVIMGGYFVMAFRAR